MNNYDGFLTRVSEVTAYREEEDNEDGHILTTDYVRPQMKSILKNTNFQSDVTTNQGNSVVNKSKIVTYQLANMSNHDKFNNSIQDNRSQKYSQRLPSGNLDQLDKKIVVLGNTGVGKTSLIRSFIFGDQDDQSMAATIGAERYRKDLSVMFRQDIKGTLRMNIWDTTGQEKFRSLSPLYYRDADACILVFDLNQVQSFRDIQDYWIQNIKDYASEGIVIALIGTYIESKSDGFECINAISKGEVETFAVTEDIAIMKYLPINTDNTTVIAMELFSELANILKQKSSLSAQRRFDSVKLDKRITYLSDNAEEKKKIKCC